jgi:hypothetical protein
MSTRSLQLHVLALRVPGRRGLLGIILLFVALVATRLDAIPIWDAKTYWACVQEAVHHAFDPLNFRCYNHPALVYLGLWGLTQYVWPWNPSVLYAVNALVGAASIVAFDVLLRVLFPNRRGAEYTLVTACYAFAPLFVSHAVFVNLDYGATAFFVLFLSCLLTRRIWLASAFAIATLFTKETGAAACAAAALAFVVAFIFRPGVPWTQRVAMLRPYTPLVSVPVALGTFLLAMALFREEPGGFARLYAPTQIVSQPADEMVLNTNLADPSIRAFLIDIFILNWQWLYTAVVAVALGAALIRVERPDEEAGAPPRRGIFIALSLVLLVYIVTRFRFTNGARYVLLASPFVILAFYHALLSLTTRHVTRLLYLATCAVLVFLSNFRTIDVVSRKIFGTFAFGSHRMLDMTSIAGGLRLDSIIYNLEFVYLQYLFADMVHDVRPRPGSVLLMGNAIYNFPPDVDGRDYTLTANPSHALPFFVAIGDVKRDVIGSHVRSDGDPFYYVSFANAHDEGLADLLKEYPLIGKKQYERHGYTLDVYTFRFSFKRSGN